jgi:transcriptional regulator with XRE-family HTH domain
MGMQIVLRRIMKDQKITFKKLAADSGVSLSTLKDWANGVAPRDLESVRKVSIALGVSFEYLCFGTENSSQMPMEMALDNIPTQPLYAGWVKLLIEVPAKQKKP